LTGLTYNELIRELFPRLTGGIRWGIERTARLLSAVGDPHRAFRSIHVGGTNGKGSVAATLSAVLGETGRRTGLYTSPHLCTFRERIRIDGEPLGEDALVAVARRLWPVIRREEPSFFEATTAIAFLAFAEAGVEAAVVEVGLGGRLDATNVIEPEVTVLTNVAMDHAEHLGDTLEAIAGEKAGIIKPGVPVVTAMEPGIVLEVFRRRAREVGTRIRALGPGEVMDVAVGLDGTRLRIDTEPWGELSLHTPLIGIHQARNTALAVRALESLAPALRPDGAAVLRGVERVKWPGRLQRERIGGETWIFDAAHNPAGVEALTASLRLLPLARPVAAVVGILDDKDWRQMLPPIEGFADHLVLTTPPSAPKHRRWDPEAVRAEIGGGAAVVVEDFDRALAYARASAPGGTILVTGSFHTVGDALIALGRAPFGADAPLPDAPTGV